MNKGLTFKRDRSKITTFERRSNKVQAPKNINERDKLMAPAPKYSPQEQEEIILNAAAECIAETSLLDFTMSSISKAAKLSMGSIYKHVQCKEDIIFALATSVFQFQSNIFSQIFE